jgi:hypothetical protein
MSEDARQMLRELLAEALAGANGNGVVPQVPPPPVAAVLRPSTWTAPPQGAEVIGGAAPARADGAAAANGAPPAGAVPVSLRSDEELNLFARTLLARPPAERDAILAGRLRFTLGAPAGAAPGGTTPPGVIRVDRGAVTERKVDEAARAGARLVLGPRAVMTPLAREKARAKGIAIERETQ